MATSIADGFRQPLGDGTVTPEFDGDDYYVAQDFDVANPRFGNARHLGEDWVPRLGGGVGDPLYAIANGEVVTTGYNIGLGYHILIRHDLPYAITVNGVETDEVASLYVHMHEWGALADGTRLQAGDLVESGDQVGLLGLTGVTFIPHLHFELRLSAEYPPGDGYEYLTPSGWTNPSDFIFAYATLGGTSGTDGDDSLSGSEDADWLHGLAGADTLDGGGGDDLLYGNLGADLLYGRDGADTLYGGQDADTLDSGDDGDLLYGNLGPDLLSGGAGADTLYGGQDADTLVGGAGDDVLVGNLGDDLMSGGDGADSFVVSGADTIADFDGSGGDRIVAAAAVSTSVDGSAGAIVTFADGSTVVLTGVNTADLSADWLGLA